MLYYVPLLIIILSFVRPIICIFYLSFFRTKDNPTQEDHSSLPSKHALIPIYPTNIQFSLSAQNLPPSKYLSKLVNNNTILNLNMNITYYFLNILASPDVSTWYTTGGPITNKNILA